MAQLPDVLTPEQMAQLQGGGSSGPASSIPDTLSPQAMVQLVQSQQPQQDNRSLGSKILSGAGHLLSKAEEPFISVAATPVQLLAKALGQEDPYAKGVPAGLPGMPEKVTPAPATPEGFLVKAGQAGQIATLAASPEFQGVKSLALLGGASGLSNSLAAGNNPMTNPTQVVRDTLYNTLFGAGLGVAGNFLGHLAGSLEAKTGVVGYVKNAIDDADPDLLKKYISTAEEHGSDIRSLTPSGLAEKAMEQRANILLDKVIPQAGQAVGDARKAAANLPLALADDSGQILAKGSDAVKQTFSQINDTVQEMTGHGFGNVAREGFEGGTRPVVYQLPGRAVELTEAEFKKLQNLHGQLDLLQSKPTAGVASDVLKNLDGMIDWDTAATGYTSPVDGAIKFARGKINSMIAPADPALAKANAAYSELMDLKGQIGQAAGKNLQHASLFMRRVLSGDKSTDVIPVLDSLDNYVKPFITRQMLQQDPLLRGDLVQHAIMSDWAKRMFGDASAQTLFEQRMTQRTADDAASLVGLPKQFARKSLTGILNSFTPDAKEYALSVAKGKPLSMDPVVRGIDKVIDSAAGAPVLGQFVKGLQDLGLSAQAAEKPAKALFKAWLLNALTQPKNYQPPGANQILPAGTPPLVTPPDQQQETSMAPQGRTLSIAQPAQQAINNVQSPTSGQQFSSQARQLGDFGMNMQTGAKSLRVT